jgi:hypothetical protein
MAERQAPRRAPELKLDSNVSDLSGRCLGTVRLILRRGVYRIRWEDGTESVEQRENLLARFTTQTPTEQDANGKERPRIAKGRIAPHIAGVKERTKVEA